MVFGFQSAKNIGICSVFCSKGLKKLRKHRLADDFWGWQKCDHLQQEEGEEEEEEQQQQQQQQQHEEEEEEEVEEEEEAGAGAGAEAEEEHAQKCDKKMCGRMLTSCGMTRTSHCALRLRTSRAHEQHQRPHYYT